MKRNTKIAAVVGAVVATVGIGLAVPALASASSTPIGGSGVNVLNVQSVPAGAHLRVTAECPSGHLITGGGASVANGTTVVEGSVPDALTGNGWAGYFQNNGTAAVLVNVNAICY